LDPEFIETVRRLLDELNSRATEPKLPEGGALAHVLRGPGGVRTTLRRLADGRGLGLFAVLAAGWPLAVLREDPNALRVWLMEISEKTGVLQILPHHRHSLLAEQWPGMVLPWSLIAFVAVLHLGFLILEMFLWTKPFGLRTFRLSPEIAQASAGLAAFTCFIWLEARSRQPMLPLSLFASRTFTGTNLLTLTVYGALGAVFFLFIVAVCGFLAAAVVAGRVAESVHGAGAADQFAKLSEALLKDKETAVVIWGMKTAKYAVGRMVQNGGNVSAFDKLIVNTVKTNRGSGPIVEEAYGALTLEPYQTSEQITKLTAAVLPDLLDLIQLRTEQYRSQDLPPSPLAEDKVDRFLPLAGFPAVKASAQTLNRPLKVRGEMTCAVLHTISDGHPSEALIALARADGSAMMVFGDQLGDKTLSGAGPGIKYISPN